MPPRPIGIARYAQTPGYGEAQSRRNCLGTREHPTPVTHLLFLDGWKVNLRARKSSRRTKFYALPAEAGPCICMKIAEIL